MSSFFFLHKLVVFYLMTKVMTKLKKKGYLGQVWRGAMNVMKMKNNIAVKYVGAKIHKTCDLALKETEGDWRRK